MESADQYGPALPPGMVTTSEAAPKSIEESSATTSTASRKKLVGPQLPPGHQQSVEDSDDLSDENPLTVKMESPTEAHDSGDNSQDGNIVGPMPSEMSQGGEDVQAADEFERRSKRMKDKLLLKDEPDEGPQKREEWMTELPPEMSKNFGLQNRTFMKGRADNEGGDRSSWTDTPATKKEKEGKGKKRKRDEEKAASAREDQMQQQVEEYNNANAVMAATSSQADSTQVAVNPAEGVVTASGVQTVNGQQVLTQQQQHMQQYYHITDDIRDSLDLLAEQKNNNGNNAVTSNTANVAGQNGVPVNVNEYYGTEYSTEQFNEAKPLADLLMTPQVVNYGQQQQQQQQQAQHQQQELNAANSGVVVGAQGQQQQQQQVVFSSSQMIAQAYSHAQQLSQGQGFQQVVASSNGNFAGGQRMVTSLQENNGNGAGMGIVSQAQMQTIEVNGQQVQAQVVQQQQQQQQQALHGTYAEAYANAVAQQDPNAAAALVQQQQQQQQHGGQVVTFSLANGQNMIIASPHTQQAAGQNYVIQSSAGQPGQSIVIAAPQQTAGMAGNFVIKDDGELGQNIVLTQQNLQQALAQGMVLTPDGHLAAPEGMTVLTQDSQGRQQIHRQQQPQQVITQQGMGQIPQQVSLVLPQVNPLFQQVQPSSTPAPVGNGIPSSGPVSPQSFMQLAAKMDRLMGLVKESQTVLLEMNRRVERIESHLFPQGVTASPGQQAGKAQIKGKPIVGGTMNKPGSTSSPTVSGSNSSTNAAVTKASLKAALSSYLTISDYTATDELKRSDSNSDLFIPVGTMSMVHGQQGHPGMMEAASPGGDGQETASSTVQELPNDQEMSVTQTTSTTGGSVDINVPIVDSQSGLAVPVYEEGTDGQKFELGPGSSKEPNARFSNTSTQPKTVILDPRFWDILVEDFQKNMSSDQIITAMAATRKPLVRSIGTSEISICSTVLKEAETACQGRRERLAKELVFRIFTLGEVYDRNVSGVFYINGKKMENKNKALDPAKMAAIHYLVMKYPPSVVDNPRLERLVWKNCVDRINDALRRIYNWIHKIVDVNNIMDKLPTEGIMMH